MITYLFKTITTNTKGNKNSKSKTKRKMFKTTFTKLIHREFEIDTLENSNLRINFNHSVQI